MSYAAVAALIAAAEWARGRFPPAEPAGAVGRALRWLAFAGFALVATTLVASLATAPFGSFHFHALNPFGLLGNALAVPLVSLVVMPCAVVGVLAFPFGLDRPIWELMGVAVAAVLRVSHWVSGFDGSTLVVPAYGADALGLMALALIVVTVLVSPLRLAALLPAAAGVWLAATPKRFDVYVDRSGAGAAIRGARGELVTTGRVSAFVVEQWLRADGDARKPDDAGLAAGGRCDALGCVVAARRRPRRRPRQGPPRLRGGLQPRVRGHLAARGAAGCKPAVLLDRPFFAAHGAAAIRFTPAGPDVVTTRQPGESRPWLQRAGPGGPARTSPSNASADPLPDPVAPAPDAEPAEPRPADQ